MQVASVARRPPASDAEPPVTPAESPPVAGGATDVALVGLLILAVLYTLFLARVLVLPIVLAILTSFILAPIVRGMRRIGIPDALGAAIVIAALAASVAWGAYTLSGPATSWLQAAPQAFSRIEARVRVVKDAVQDLGQATSRVEQLATVGAQPTLVAVQGPGLGELLFFGTWNVVAAVGLVLILGYFLLASGDLFLRKVVTALPRLRDRKVAVAMSREIQESVSAYLFTVSLINAVFGAAVGFAMLALGMPNPLLWAALAAILNFIPFIGPLVGIAIVFAAAVLTYNTFGAALAPPGAYLALHILEGSFLTPLILSRRFTLNPVVVILGLVFWGWIWGIPGALLAMPLLVTLKILCDHIPSLAVLGEFLGD